MIKHLMILLLLPLALWGVPEVRVVTVDRDGNVKPDGVFMSATNRTERLWSSDGTQFIDGTATLWRVTSVTVTNVVMWDSRLGQATLFMEDDGAELKTWETYSGDLFFACGNVNGGGVFEAGAYHTTTDAFWYVTCAPNDFTTRPKSYSHPESGQTGWVDRVSSTSVVTSRVDDLATLLKLVAATNGLAPVALVQAATNGLVTASVTNGLASAALVQAATNGLAPVALVQTATNGMVKFTAQTLSSAQQAQARANIGAPGPYPTNIVAGFQTFDYGSNGWVRIVSSNHLLSVYEVLP
jgi:hypothetical protein